MTAAAAKNNKSTKPDKTRGCGRCWYKPDGCNSAYTMQDSVNL